MFKEWFVIVLCIHLVPIHHFFESVSLIRTLHEISTRQSKLTTRKQATLIKDILGCIRILPNEAAHEH